MPLLTKRIYEPDDVGDGHRLLVMRYWPRGVRKERVDEWQRALAPTKELLADLNSGAIEWGEYVERFRAEMASRPGSAEAIDELRRRSASETVTVLCWCKDENRCHRGLLRELVEAA
jgi:uncharacterized protein YeaO (DUF488 family)